MVPQLPSVTLRQRAKAFAWQTLSAFAYATATLLLPLRFALRVLRKKPISIWTGNPILNMGLNARAERLLGVRSYSVVLFRYHLSADFDFVLDRWFPGRARDWVAPFLTFLAASLFADRVHFYYDRSLLTPPGGFGVREWELRWFRWIGAATFFWTYGADIRTQTETKALGSPNCCTDCTIPGIACICVSAPARANVAVIHKYARGFFAMGDMLEYTEGSRNDLYFWPVDLVGRAARYRAVIPDATATGPLRVVHAPNHRMFKGTRFLLEAVAKLQAEGVAIALDLVEGVPNTEALERYRAADVVFDQCIVGFHGFFAIEGMAMGKPVLCFIRRPNEYLLKPEECPIVRIRHDTLVEDLRRLALDRALVADIGKRGRLYVEKYYTLEAFAGRLQIAYRELGVPT